MCYIDPRHEQRFVQLLPSFHGNFIAHESSAMARLAGTKFTSKKNRRGGKMLIEGENEQQLLKQECTHLMYPKHKQR